MASVALRIGEVARRAGLSVRTLRHYHDLGLLVPSTRTHGAQRMYATQDLRRLLTIQHLKALGLSLAEVKDALDDPGFDAAAALSEHIASVEARRDDLDDLLARLRGVQAAAEAGWEEVLSAVALTERLQHPEAGVRVRAALDGGPDAPVQVLLDRLAREPDDHVADTLTWAVARHGSGAVGQVVPRLAATDPRQRRRMAQALGKLADPGAVPALVSTLADDDPQVACAAVVALGRIAHPAGLPSLIDRLGGTDHAAVTDAITRFGAVAVDPLTQVLRGGRASGSRRRHAAEVLGAIGDGTAVPVLEEMLRDDDATVCQAAVIALGHLPRNVANAAIRRASSSEDHRVRAVAIRLEAGPSGRSPHPPGEPHAGVLDPSG